MQLEDLGRFVAWLRLLPAERALDELHREGRPISVAGLARAVRVSRSWAYTQPDLLDRLQRQNQTARKSREGAAERASDTSLKRRLELAHQQIRQLTTAATRWFRRPLEARCTGPVRPNTRGLGGEVNRAA